MAESEIMSVRESPSESPNTDGHDSLSKVYAYLLGCPVMKLRKMAQVWKCHQNAEKNVLVASLYLYILDRIRDGGSLEQIRALNPHLADFEQWCDSNSQQLVLSDPPDREQLLKVTSCVPKPAIMDVTDPDMSLALAELNDSLKDLSLSEFARLLLIIKSVDFIKKGIQELKQTSLEDTRAAKHRKTWLIIEKLFNNSTVKPILDLKSFNDVDAAKMPLRFRSSVELMKSYYWTKHLLLQYVEMWKDGIRLNDDPPTFSDCLRKALSRNGAYLLSARKVLLMWGVFECWFESPDAVILGLSPTFTYIRKPLEFSVLFPSEDVGVSTNAPSHNSREKKMQKRKRDF